MTRLLPLRGPDGVPGGKIRFIRLEYDGRDWDDGMDAASAGPMLDALIGFAMDPLDIARMSIPALFLAGEEDLYTPPWMVERTARLWPGARFQVLPNVAHIVPREAPADLARLTLQFLSDNGI